MKHNIFVPHTQYNLIISLAMVSGPYKGDENDLILFTDFDITESMKQILETYFTRVMYCSGTYPKINKSWKNKIKTIPATIFKLEKFLNKSCDCLLLVCDTAIPEIWLIKYLMEKNSQLKIQWIEDGAWPYFTNDAIQTGFNKNSFVRSIRLIIGKLIFGKYYSFRGNNIGSNNWIQDYLLTYPDATRKGFCENKRKIEIADNDFQKGMQILFSETNYLMPDHAIIIVLDKLDVYRSKESVLLTLEKIFAKCNALDIPVYYKCHPREEETIQTNANVKEIDKKIGIEGIYTSNLGKNLTFIGIKSTGLQTARKCGFKAVSLACLLNEANENVIDFYGKIKIEQIHNSEEFDAYINNLNVNHNVD